MNEQDQLIKQKRLQVDELRKKVTAAQAANNPEAVQRQIKTNENRLQTVHPAHDFFALVAHIMYPQVLNKYNTQLTTNAKMRQVIDHLKQERDSFDGIYKKLEKELGEVKKQMADVIEKSNQVRCGVSLLLIVN